MRQCVTPTPSTRYTCTMSVQCMCTCVISGRLWGGWMCTMHGLGDVHVPYTEWGVVFDDSFVRWFVRSSFVRRCRCRSFVRSCVRLSLSFVRSFLPSFLPLFVPSFVIPSPFLHEKQSCGGAWWCALWHGCHSLFALCNRGTITSFSCRFLMVAAV